MKKPRYNVKGMTLIELLVVISIIGILVWLSLTAIGPIITSHKGIGRRRMHLVDLHKILMIYQQDYGCYPSVQPPETRYEKSGGVRDLYPLYTSGLLKPRDLNEILHHPKAKLLDFSDQPTIDEKRLCHVYSRKQKRCS